MKLSTVSGKMNLMLLNDVVSWYLCAFDTVCKAKLQIFAIIADFEFCSKRIFGINWGFEWYSSRVANVIGFVTEKSGLSVQK
jgi:hypothetical protein